MAIWKIEETEPFFLEKVPLSRSITHPHKRLQHLAGRYLLQYLFPDFPIQLIQIADTRKPYLASESHHFSISHCGDFAAAIVSTSKRVGIDIEIHAERIYRLQHKFLNDHETLIGREVGGFYPTLVWSVKEAMYKWYSLGEIDFQEQLLVQTVVPVSQTTGQVAALLQKESGITLELPYKVFNDLILTWVVK